MHIIYTSPLRHILRSHPMSPPSVHTWKPLFYICVAQLHFLTFSNAHVPICIFTMIIFAAIGVINVRTMSGPFIEWSIYFCRTPERILLVWYLVGRYLLFPLMRQRIVHWKSGKSAAKGTNLPLISLEIAYSWFSKMSLKNTKQYVKLYI